MEKCLVDKNKRWYSLHSVLHEALSLRCAIWEGGGLYNRGLVLYVPEKWVGVGGGSSNILSSFSQGRRVGVWCIPCVNIIDATPNSHRCPCDVELKQNKKKGRKFWGIAPLCIFLMTESKNSRGWLKGLKDHFGSSKAPLSFT